MSTSEDTEYTLAPKTNHGGLIAGLVIAGLALIAVFSYYSWMSSSPSEQATVYEFQIIKDITPFKELVSDSTITATDDQMDRAYYQQVKADEQNRTNRFLAAVYPHGSVSEGDDELDYFDDDSFFEDFESYDFNPMSQSNLDNPFTHFILGISLEFLMDPNYDPVLYEKTMLLWNELELVAQAANNKARPTSQERFSDISPSVLPYPKALLSTYPSYHALVAYLLRDLALVEVGLDESTDEYYQIQAGQELKDFLDHGIFLGLYSHSELKITELFYQLFSETVRSDSNFKNSLPVFIPIVNK